MFPLALLKSQATYFAVGLLHCPSLHHPWPLPTPGASPNFNDKKMSTDIAHAHCMTAQHTAAGKAAHPVSYKLRQCGSSPFSAVRSWSAVGTFLGNSPGSPIIKSLQCFCDPWCSLPTLVPKPWSSSACLWVIVFLLIPRPVPFVTVSLDSISAFL